MPRVTYNPNMRTASLVKTQPLIQAYASTSIPCSVSPCPLPNCVQSSASSPSPVSGITPLVLPGLESTTSSDSLMTRIWRSMSTCDRSIEMSR